MSRLLLVGASVEMAALARSLGHTLVAVADPQVVTDVWQGLPVVRDDDGAVGRHSPDAVLMAIDEPAVRARVQEAFAAQGIAVASVIGGYLGEDAVYGEGLVVQRLAHVSEACRLGRGVRLNVGANVMHNGVLDDFVTVAPNAVTLGDVEIGARSYVGANATILPHVRIGCDCMIGAGAVVTKDLADGSTVKGVPAR